MQITTYYPNVVAQRSFTTGVTTFVMPATDGTLYASYGALIAAGKTPWPGNNSDFPTGIPVMNIRTTNAAGTGDGSSIAFKTNTIYPPADIHDIDDLVSGSGQQVAMPGGIKMIYVAQTTAGDYTILNGRF